MDCGRLAGDTRAVLRHHAMSAAMTPDLRRWVVCVCEGGGLQGCLEKRYPPGGQRSQGVGDGRWGAVGC